MIAEMKKLNLAAMSYDREKVLNALQRTGAAEVKCHTPVESVSPLPFAGDELRARLSASEAALAALVTEADRYRKDNKIKTEPVKDGFGISYTEFMAAGENAERMHALTEEVNRLLDEKNALKNELARAKRAAEAARPYSKLNVPFSALGDTRCTRTLFGYTTVSQAAELQKEELPELCALSTLGAGEVVLISVTAHGSCMDEVQKRLQKYAFAPCPYTDGRTGKELFEELSQEIARLTEALSDNGRAFSDLSEHVRDFKIYCDFLAFGLEKEELSEKLLATERTFLLEAYVPAEQEEAVRAELAAAAEAICCEFTDVPEDETPPTLCKNNAVVSNFEAITDMYSPPNAREFDPNAIMAFFYSLFLGFIMADVGYGLLMFFGGGFLYFKMRKGTMMKRLCGVFAIGGIFTVIWGFLFNSFLGFALLPFKVMPDLTGDGMSWSLAGIKVPALLIISMMIGVVQLFAGYCCRAVQCWRKGNILDGIFDGAVWALFSLGVELAIAGFVEDFGLSVLGTVGGIVAGASLVVAVLTAGRKEKLLGKFTKGFGAAYGVINYASDILSYARLYGLMLAGAVIADIISSNSVSLIASGNAAFIILGAVIMVVGHVFNLAIGLLGAYIHDARLQYVEFYGRFYEGEGELFTPLGSEHRHVWIAPDSSEKTAVSPQK